MTPPDGKPWHLTGLIAISMLLAGPPALAQTPAIESGGDSTAATINVKPGSIFAGRPGKAMLYSLILPGAGQLYTKSYARVPFVWAAVGGMGYLVQYNTARYRCLDAAYKAAVDKVPFVPTKRCPESLAEDLMAITDPSRLRALRDGANQDMQLSIIGFSLVWLANGIDAFVNAHLKEFDVTDDLSMGQVFHIGDDPFTPLQYGVYLRF